MLLGLLRLLLLFAFVRFAVRLVRWLMLASHSSPASRRAVPGVRPGEVTERPRIVDVPFTEERSGKDAR